jgi:hypothetical protein
MLSRVLVTAVLAAAATPAAAQAADPAWLYDAPGQQHANVCVHLAASPADLRFGDGAATGFQVSNSLSFDPDGECAAGTVRLDHHESIPSNAGGLVFHRGGDGYADDDNTKYGELATAAIADPLPPPEPPGGGRGAPCRLAQEPAYEAQIRSIPGPMNYKPPPNNGSSYLHYGDPGADQGDRQDIHYGYLLWSWIDVASGGMVRTLLAPSQSIRACDVDPITTPSWDSAGNVNGTVTARYVRVLAGTCPIYGWTVWSHDYYGDADPPVAHAITAATQPPDDPPPDPACPVADPPHPPAVATGDATPGAPGAATLNGTVNPQGVPADYRFDYGPGPEYGASVEGQTKQRVHDVPVSLPVDGLTPGAPYHYRLAATNMFGTTYGADRTFVAPAIAKLKKLRLRPAAFKRARRAKGVQTRIRYAINVPGTVTFSFQRKKRPRRGHPKWIAVGAVLTKRASQGSNSHRFGGWLAGRKLARGRYKLIAVPADANGVPGHKAKTYFTLR